LALPGFGERRAARRVRRGPDPAKDGVVLAERSMGDVLRRMGFRRLVARRPVREWSLFGGGCLGPGWCWGVGKSQRWTCVDTASYNGWSGQVIKNAQGALQVIGDGGETNLDGCFGKPAPSHSTKAKQRFQVPKIFSIRLRTRWIGPL
jgi:hypothetical protein